ncbi:hypothetical protein BC830DRAFT_1216233 [Chytriomyces sp. MP71]|nr:hypothetical protein BC830DRAFT_1216233 [Chytriomyces sp. MP71]
MSNDESMDSTHHQSKLESKAAADSISKLVALKINEDSIAIAADSDNGIKDRSSKFKFTCLEDAVFPGFNDKEIQSLLFKWGLRDNCYLKRFAFDKKLHPLDIDRFFLDFVNDPVVNAQFQHCFESDVLRPDGSIKKCMDEYVDSFLVADELRKCLLTTENKGYATFSAEDRNEFVFHLFKALCLGGKLCQYEDEIEPYLKATKKIYKDFITVTRNVSGNLQVASRVFKLVDVQSSVSPLFPRQHPQNFCYVSVDPIKRNANVFYHANSSFF